MRIRIRLFHFGGLVACLLLPGLSLSAQSQDAGAGFVVSYVEAPAAKASALAADVKAYAGQIENGPGKPKVTILEEVGRANRMVVIEQWPDLSSAAFAASGDLLTAKVQQETLAPVDRRVNHPLTPAIEEPAGKAFVVLMHDDISGNAPAAVSKTLEAQRDAVLAAPGAIGYEVAVQDKRANHFAVCEVWKSRAAYEAYAATAPAEDLRRQFASLIGSPFDDRYFTIVK